MQLARNKGALTAPSEDEAYKLFTRQLGVDVDRIREKSMVQAISEPDKWLKKRNETLDKALEGAATLYQQKYKEFLDFGYPLEQVDAMAVSLARNLYENEKKIIEDLYVGYDGQMRTRELDRTMKDGNTRNMIGSVDREAHITESDRKGIIREYKKRKGYGKYAKK